MARVVVIEAKRESYSIGSLYETMKVKELIDYLSQFDGDADVVLSHDNGYTYGGITEDNIELR